MIETIKKHNAFFRQLIFLGILLLMGAVMVKQLAFFVGAFLGALTFYIVFRRMVFRMVEHHRWPAWLAALVIVIGLSAILLAAMFGVFEMVAHEIINVDTSQLLVVAKEAVPKINDMVGFNLVSANMVSDSSTYLAKIASTVVNATYSFAANILMTVIILYFMLTHARTLETRLSKYMPFQGDNRAELLDDVTSIIYSNAVGIPLVMLSQGVVAGLIYWAFGLPNVVFWAFFTALCGLIPMIGTVIVSVPIGVWFIAQGHVWQGIVVMACGLLLIANVDNVTRIILNKKISNTHPLIVIFGVVMGIPLFGFWGIIFGPLMISVFLLLIRIYFREYKLLPDDPAAPEQQNNN